MPDWLSPEWAEEVAALAGLLPAAAAGANGSVSLAFVAGPRREVVVHWRYDDGKVVDAGAGPVADPGLTLSLAGPDAADVLSGRVEPSVAFMRGRLKASGDGALLLAFLSSTTAEEFGAWRARVAGLAPAPV